MEGEVIRFARYAFRVSNKLPSQVIQRKFRFNIREAIEFYKSLNDAALSKERMEQGWKVIGTFEKLLDGPEDVVKRLFKPFEFMERAERQKSPVTNVLNKGNSNESSSSPDEPLKAVENAK